MKKKTCLNVPKPFPLYNLCFVSPGKPNQDYYGDQGDYTYDYGEVKFLILFNILSSTNVQPFFQEGIQDDVDGQSREQNSISTIKPVIISQPEHLVVDNGMTISMPCVVDQIPGKQFLLSMFSSFIRLIIPNFYQCFALQPAFRSCGRSLTPRKQSSPLGVGL